MVIVRLRAGDRPDRLSQEQANGQLSKVRLFRAEFYSTFTEATDRIQNPPPPPSPKTQMTVLVVLGHRANA